MTAALDALVLGTWDKMGCWSLFHLPAFVLAGGQRGLPKGEDLKGGGPHPWHCCQLEGFLLCSYPTPRL
jgi:hypothetical protein